MADFWRSIAYDPHPGQAALHAARQRFQVMIAGARFGKSACTAREMVRELVSHGCRGWIVAPSYALTRPEFRYISQVAVKVSQIHKIKHGGRTAHSSLHGPCGAEVLALSAGSPTGLLGEELDWLLLCEAAHLDRESWERYLRPRLSTRLGRMVAASTPRGSNWLHELYVRAGEGGEWARFHFATWENPMILAEEIESARKMLPPEVFDEQYGAQFVALSGRVYPEFAQATHVAKLGAPEGRVVTRGIDFGFTNPLAVVWVAQDGNGKLLVLREYYRDGVTVEEAAADMRNIEDGLRAQGLLIGRAFADPSGATQREVLARLGTATTPANNSLRGGIDIVRTALRARVDGTPGLRIDASCNNLIREMESYCWLESLTGVEKVPEKRDDHALDALRYAVVGLKQKVGWQGSARNC